MKEITKNLHDPRYWEHFRLGYLKPEERPTPTEAAEAFTSLLVQIDQLKEELKRSRIETKSATQQFDTFAIEVSNLAHKRRPVNSVS